MDSYLQQFLTYGKETVNYSVATLKGYGCNVREFLRWLAADGVTTPGAITLGHVQRFDVDQSRKGNRPRVRRRKIAAIRAFLAWCADAHVIEVSPALKIKLPPNDDPTRVAPTLAEKDALIDGCSRMQSEYVCALCATLLACMFYAGLRPAEVCALEVADIDLQRRRLIVQHGKGDKRREVPLSETLTDALTAWMPVRKPSTWLFVSATGRPMSYPILSRLFVQIKIAAGLRNADHLTAHCLRHWFASHLHANGSSVVVIQKLMGHTNLNSTQVYLHAMQDELDDAIRGLDNTRSRPIHTKQKPRRCVTRIRR